MTPLIHYLVRRTTMHSTLVQQHASALVHERQQRAEAATLARRLLAVRRWQRRADAAERQVRLARLAVR